MPAVFIHGVPDTYRVWDPTLQKLSRTDVVALALPGFDSALPDGFSGSKEEYVDWIIAQLGLQSGPVDLIGHDWGCILVARVASLRPDLVRTWAAGGGPVSQEYEWHPLAKLLQTPGAGEKWVAEFNATQFGGQLEQLGLPAAFAAETVPCIDQQMLNCILRLYRSAVHVGSQWQGDLSNVTSPGLVLWGRSDQGCPVLFADQLGRDTKASRILKLDAGHWFPLQKPSEVAAALEEHWAA